MNESYQMVGKKTTQLKENSFKTDREEYFNAITSILSQSLKITGGEDLQLDAPMKRAHEKLHILVRQKRKPKNKRETNS